MPLDILFARAAKHYLQQALDNWPDDGQLNPQFDAVSQAHAVLARYCKEHSEDARQIDSAVDNIMDGERDQRHAPRLP